MIRLLIIFLLSVSLLACASTSPPSLTSGQISNLQQGKRFFDQGFYKRAMQQLLPLACDGVPDAEYAIGYMYYYGLGVAQDTDVGYFWIKRAASQRYIVAIRALPLLEPGNGIEMTRLKSGMRSKP